MTLQLNHSVDSRIEKDDLDMRLKPLTFKYALRCNQCSWNVSFSEASGSIHLDNHKMLCPLCKQQEIRWIRFTF